jgi:hypothetical protein
MKADTEEKVKDAEDDFWKIHIPFFTAQFSTYYTRTSGFQRSWRRSFPGEGALEPE